MTPAGGGSSPPAFPHSLTHSLTHEIDCFHRPLLHPRHPLCHDAEGRFNHHSRGCPPGKRGSLRRHPEIRRGRVYSGRESPHGIPAPIAGLTMPLERFRCRRGMPPMEGERSRCDGPAGRKNGRCRPRMGGGRRLLCKRGRRRPLAGCLLGEPLR